MNNNIELVELNKICNINSGGTPSRKKTSYFGGKIKWAKISDLEKAGDGYIYDTDEKITAEGLNNIRNKIFENGTLFLAMYGSVGKTAITKNEMSCNQAILGITAKNENDLDLKFLKYWLVSKNKELLNSAKGVALKNLSAGMVKKLKIPLPPLSTQKRIAEILDNAAALRDKTQQLLTEYDQLAQSIFLDMFGDPVTNPKGWEKEPIKKLGITTTGSTPSRKVSDYYGDYIEWIKTDNINTPNMYLTRAEEYLSEKGLIKGRKVNEGAILVTCIAGSRKVIGNVSIADRAVSFNQQINAFEPHNKLSLFWYFQFILSKKYVQNNSTNGMKGIITKGKFEKMELISPPDNLQNQFADKIALIEQQKDLAKQELQESEDLFQALLQRAFKGELN